MTMCYKDMTFCAAKCATVKCIRNLTPKVEEGARLWWSHDPDNAPIALSDFSETCGEYIEVME